MGLHSLARESCLDGGREARYINGNSHDCPRPVVRRDTASCTVFKYRRRRRMIYPRFVSNDGSSHRTTI